VGQTEDGTAAGPPVDVVVVDDHPLFSRGLSLLLPGLSGGRVRVVATTDDASAGAALVRRHHADVAIVDLHMPPPGGTRAIAAIRRADPLVRVVALSGLGEADAAFEALRAGAAFLPKTADPELLVRPLLAVLDGWSVVPEALLRQLLADAQPTGDQGLAERLSADERRLWRLIADGATTVDIATTLHVSERTAKRLVAHLLRRLDVATRVEAAALAGRVGLGRDPGSAGRPPG
jgi:two-component system nitrate/nitrite response regulator NarL